MQKASYLDRQCWRTAEGKTIPFEEVTQQHWSNIHWFHLYQVHHLELDIQKMKNELSDNDTPIVKQIVDDLITDKKRRIFQLQELANIGLTQINLRFKGELLEWEPKYPEEKTWYANQCTRKILTEFIRIKK